MKISQAKIHAHYTQGPGLFESLKNKNARTKYPQTKTAFTVSEILHKVNVKASKWANGISLVGHTTEATSQGPEYAARTFQDGVPRLAKDYNAALIDSLGRLSAGQGVADMLPP